MQSYLVQSVEMFEASQTVENIDIAQRRALIISAARAIHRMHLELNASLMPVEEPESGNIVYDLAELATLLDDGVPDQIVASGLREAGSVMMKLCALLTASGAIDC